ncbi:hypothetical protein [Aurantibacter sp.]|uniref:hypothetical protein n=1 Tax=Aurantibacter sp. TaxID=2807103 RepID=UPI0035C7C7C9
MKFIICFLLSFVAFSQQDSITKQFPEDYLGIYKGKLKIDNPRGQQEIEMEFHLKATDGSNVFKYTLVYVVNGEPSPRNYTLKIIDKAKGEYVVDENNGIILDAKYVNNSLISVFEVQGNLLITTERFFDDYMFFEIVFSGKDSKKTTIATEDQTEVISYPITTTQTAKLIKQ